MRFRILLLMILSVGLLSFYALPVAAQATITVNSTLDSDPPATDGACTLREAIFNANNNAATWSDCVAGTGTDTIAFNIPGVGPHTITVSSVSDFPNITAPVLIDGLTQPGSNCSTGLQIVINGALTPSAAGWGITLASGASGSTVRGLVIQGFTDGVGIIFFPNSNNNIVQCNYLGTDATGTSAVANRTGIFVSGGAQNNLMGTNGDGVDDANEGNVISGNNFTGIALTGATTTGNRIAGNKIGTDRTGTAALGNTEGIRFSSGVNNNFVGLDNTVSAGDANEGNLISGNSNYGVLIYIGSPNNRVAGNKIGTNLAGTGAIPNGTGISIQDSSDGNIIGTNGDGTSDALEGNLISGNTNAGVNIAYFSSGATHSSNNVVAGNLIGTDVTGTLDLGNGGDGVFISTTNNLIGTDGDGVSDALERNIISGNNDNGVEINGTTASGNHVAGNYIGTNLAGIGAIGNSNHGVTLTNGANANFIGTNGDGTGDGNERNLISGNVLVGVFLIGATTTNNRIAGNRIGTDLTGNADLGNGNAGILSQGSANSSIIGTNGDGVSDALEGNQISGNNAGGIILAASNNNRVAGNFIGTNNAGTAALANSSLGISIQNNGGSNIIGTNGDGTADALEGNLIAGNSGTGLAIASGSTLNIIAGNRIGTNQAGTAAIGNAFGVSVSGNNNRIGTDNNGTSDAIETNVISGNNGNGFSLSGSSATNNTVAGNIIGLNATATASLANNGSGVTIENGASNNTIGGAADAQSNFIGGNTTRGIYVTGTNTTNNSINNNTIGTNAAQASLPNGTNGIEIDATGTGQTTVMNNWIFYHPTTGILLSNAADLGAAGVSEQNCLYQNAAGVNNTTGINTFFENNWWGAASGPSGVGTGNGDSVSANVDYIVFLTTAPTACPGIAGVFIDPLAVSAVEAGTVSYTVMLESSPAIGETVTITMAIDPAAIGEINGVNPPTLSFNFTSANWNIPQQFDIALNDDILANGNRTHTAAFTHSSDSTDPASGYDAAAALVIDSVDLMVVDNETPNVVINPTAFGVRTGDTRTYDISLTLEPTTNVTITLTRLDTNCTISTTTLTFTDSAGANPWNVPQQVTVTAVGAVGSTCTIQHTPTGGAYTGVVVSDAVATIRRDLGIVPPTTGTGGEPAIGVFDPAISKIGTLFPGQTGIVGEELEWVVTVSNVGTVAGVNVTVTDTLIPALRIDSVDAPGATVTISGQTVTVVYPNLAVGQSVNFSIFTTVLSGVTVDNTACVNATNQGVQECASAISASVSQLPSTGETPFWRYGLMAGIGLVIVSMAALIRKSGKAKA